MSEIGINALKMLAIEGMDELKSNEDIRKHDLTDTFWREFDLMLKNKELINIQIIGEKTLGKSVIMSLLVWKGNEKLGKRMGLWAIKADQSEYGEYIRNEAPDNVFNGIDEWNEMSETGAGATTEKAYLNYQSDVSAQKFRHRVSCSPSTLVDQGANIVLEVIAKDTNKKINRCLVSYRIIKHNMEATQLIGYVDFFVGELIAMEKNPKSWYSRYRQKKFLRMELMNKYGIQTPRELEQAEIIRELFNELKEFAKAKPLNRALLKSFIKVKKMERKQLHSLILTEEMVEELDALLRLETDGQKLLYEVDKQTKKGDIHKAQILESAVQVIVNNRDKILASLDRKIEINKRYRNIG